MSALGMRLRNKQWADYINAVKPFYDILVVYSGSGHTNNPSESWADVPILVGEKYITFNFYTTEKNLQEQDFQETSYKILCDNHACSMVPISITAQESAQPQIVPIWGKKTLADSVIWDGKSILYGQEVNAETDKYIKSLPKEQQHTFYEITDTLEKAGIDKKLNMMDFDVFLPEWPKYPL